jgi:hypothetical protein
MSSATVGRLPVNRTALRAVWNAVNSSRLMLPQKFITYTATARSIPSWTARCAAGQMLRAYTVEKIRAKPTYECQKSFPALDDIAIRLKFMRIDTALGEGV